MTPTSAGGKEHPETGGEHNHQGVQVGFGNHEGRDQSEDDDEGQENPIADRPTAARFGEPSRQVKNETEFEKLRGLNCPRADRQPARGAAGGDTPTGNKKEEV